MVISCFLVILLLFKPVYATWMLSTESPGPDILSTPRNSLQNEIAKREKLASILHLTMAAKTLSNLTAILVNKKAAEMETYLKSLEEISTVVAKDYGFVLMENVLPVCPLDYFSEKENLLREIDTIQNNCMEVLDNYDVLKLSSPNKTLDDAIIRGCSERVQTLPIDLAMFLSQNYIVSYQCALSKAQASVGIMSSTDYLSKLFNESLLLLEEVENLIGLFDIYAKANPKTENVSEWDTFKTIKRNISEVKEALKDGVFESAINRFYEALWNETGEENTTLNKENSLFDEYLDPALTTTRRNSSSWILSQGVYKVVYLKKFLRKTIMRLMLLGVPRDFVTEVEGSLKSKEIFVANSTTMGKSCVNSPIHPVGTCNSNNFEVCKSLLVTHDHFSYSLSGADLTMGQVTPVQDIKQCTCGASPKCLKWHNPGRLYECALVANEFGQCRGDQNYPCIRFPLQRGYHDESCLSGHCNEETRTCLSELEDRTVTKSRQRRESKIRRIQEWTARTKQKWIQYLIKVFEYLKSPSNQAELWTTHGKKLLMSNSSLT